MMQFKNNESELRILWFNNIKGVGFKTKQYLLMNFGSIENVYEASEASIQSVLDKMPRKRSITINKNLDRIKRLKNLLEEKGIWYVYPGHKAYPEKLLNIYEPPQILYIKGRLKEDLGKYNNNVAIVGSRNPSIYGKEMARMFGRELATERMCVISGLAMGIDASAHLGALDAGGYTVGVLGCAINTIYPRENIEIYRMIEENGTIISEYPAETPISPGAFPMRNRIISGLSDGVMVVEAKKKSGSLITADLALEQGKQVYALPGRAMDVNSEGTNRLIKMGAMCVTIPDDIILDMKGEKISESCQIHGTYNKMEIEPEEEKVYNCINLEPVYIDDIIRKTNLGVTKTISTLYALEGKGLVKQPLKGYYIVAI